MSRGRLAIVALAFCRLPGGGAGRPAPFEDRWCYGEASQPPDAGKATPAPAPRPFEFPADHGPHLISKPSGRYFTGNLESKEGTAPGSSRPSSAAPSRPKTTKENRPGPPANSTSPTSP